MSQSQPATMKAPTEPVVVAVAPEEVAAEAVAVDETIPAAEEAASPEAAEEVAVADEPVVAEEAEVAAEQAEQAAEVHEDEAAPEDAPKEDEADDANAMDAYLARSRAMLLQAADPNAKPDAVADEATASLEDAFKNSAAAAVGLSIDDNLPASRSGSHSRANSGSYMGVDSPLDDEPRAGTADSHEAWKEHRGLTAGAKREREDCEEEDNGHGRVGTSASPAPTPFGGPSSQDAKKAAAAPLDGSLASEAEANAATANISKAAPLVFGAQAEYLPPTYPLLLTEADAKVPCVDRMRMLLDLIPDDDRMCTLHLSQPPLPLPAGEGSPTPANARVPHVHPHFPSFDIIKRFFFKCGYTPFVHQVVRPKDSTFHNVYCLVDFETRQDAVLAFLNVGSLVKIGDAVLRVGWAKTISVRATPVSKIPTPEERAYRANYAAFLKTEGPYSNADWHNYQEEEATRLAPAPLPVPVQRQPVAPAPRANGAAKAPHFGNDAPTSSAPKASYLPASFKQPEAPVKEHIAGPMRAANQSRAHQSKELPRVILREFGAPRILNEAADHIRYNRNVLQLTTAVDPLMNFEALNGQGVYCDSPMYALPFEDEKAVYEAVSQFGEINGITFTPERRAVFVTYARPQSVVAAVLRAKQSNWLEGGVRASALGHSTQGK